MWTCSLWIYIYVYQRLRAAQLSFSLCARSVESNVGVQVCFIAFHEWIFFFSYRRNARSIYTERFERWFKGSSNSRDSRRRTCTSARYKRQRRRQKKVLKAWSGQRILCIRLYVLHRIVFACGGWVVHFGLKQESCSRRRRRATEQSKMKSIRR